MNGGPPTLADRLGALADPNVPLTPEAPKRAPGSVLVYDNATGEQRDMSPEEATAAFKAGAVNLVKNHPIGVIDDAGEMRIENTDNVSDALAKGGSLIGADVAHKAQLAREYSGAKGALISLGSGLDTATAGLGSLAAEGLSGDSEGTREAIEASDEQHPYVHAAGAIGGALALGHVLPGGAIEDAATGALARATGGAISKDAAGLGARMLAKGAGGVARGAAEGSIFDLSSALNENAINDGDHQLTGEQLVARVGHGALLGGALGGIAAGGIEAAATGVKSLREGTAPLADSIASKEMWRDLNAAQTVSRKVLNRVEGGEAAIGKTAREIGLDDPMLSSQEQLEIADKAKETTGKAIGDMYRQSSATGTARPLVEKLDALISDVDGIAGAENVAAGLKKYRQSLLGRITQNVDEAGAATAGMDPTELRLYTEELRLRGVGNHEQADSLKLIRENKFGVRKAADPLDHPVSLGELWDQRRGLDRLLKFESARDPEQRIQLLRDFRKHFQSYLEETGEKAAKAAGTEFSAPLKALNERYSHLGYINEALETKAVRQMANRRFSLTDTIAQSGGLSAAATAALTGHPLVAAGALASGLANKVMRQQGPRIAAYLLGRTSSLEDVAMHAGHIDDAIARAATGLLERPAPPESGTFQVASPAVERVASMKHEDVRDRYDTLAKDVRNAAGHPELRGHFDAQLASVAQHAPKVAQAAAATAKKATDYLAANLPKPVALDPLQPNEQHPASHREMTQWLRRYDAVDEPEKLFEQVSARAIDPVALDAVKTVYPSVFAKLQHAVMRAMLADPKKFTRGERLALSPVVGAPLTPSRAPATAMSRQAMYANAAPPPGQGGGQENPRGSKSSKTAGASRETASERIERGD